MRIICPLLVAVSLVAPATPANALASRIVHPTGATDVVIRVSSGGGFVAPQSLLGAVPEFTLYGDGTIIVPGAIPQISPGPAIRPLLRGHLREPQVQALLRQALRSGLLARHPIDYGDMGSVGISDAPSTTVRVHAAGRRVLREAYALGIATGSSRMPPAQATARRDLARFVAALPTRPTGAHYTPQAVVVFITPWNTTGQPVTGPSIRWPLAGDLATAGRRLPTGPGYRCLALRGSAAKTLLATLHAANDRSRWTARARSKRAYALIARPLLPDERRCGSLST